MAQLSKCAEEMMVQILSRLPPESLMRFKCVNTSWYALINNPNFITKHLDVSKHNKFSTFSTVIFKRYVLGDMNTGKKKLVLSLCNLIHNDDDHDDVEEHHLHTVVEDIYAPPSMRLMRTNCYGDERIELSGHCDGIICLTDMRKKVVLCNPATQEFKLLPVSNLLMSSPDFNSDNDLTLVMGFGYDLKSNTYKVVRMLHYAQDYTDDDRVTIHPPKAEVYSLVTKDWHEIKTDNLVRDNVIALPLYKYYALNSIYCKGLIFWCAKEYPKESTVCYTPDENEVREYPMDCTISFHLADETFHVISSPDHYSHKRVFGLWNDSIAISCWSNDNSIDIWVLDEIGGCESSWTKYSTFQPVIRIPFLLTFVGKNDQFFFVSMDHSVVIFYEFHTEKFKYLPLKGVSLWNCEANLYVNSIVSVR